MGRDNKTKVSKKEMNKKEPSKKKKQLESSDDDNGSFYTDDDSENENEIDIHEYRKFLKKMYPSKHLDKKIKSGERVKNASKPHKDETSDNSDSVYEYEDDCEDYDYVPEESSVEETYTKFSKKKKQLLKKKKYESDGHIIFTIVSLSCGVWVASHL